MGAASRRRRPTGSFHLPPCPCCKGQSDCNSAAIRLANGSLAAADPGTLATAAARRLPTCRPLLLPPPSLPAGYKGASDLYIDANIQLAIAAGRKVRHGSCCTPRLCSLPGPGQASLWRQLLCLLLQLVQLQLTVA